MLKHPFTQYIFKSLPLIQLKFKSTAYFSYLSTEEMGSPEFWRIFKFSKSSSYCLLIKLKKLLEVCAIVGLVLRHFS